MNVSLIQTTAAETQLVKIYRRVILALAKLATPGMARLAMVNPH